MKFIITFILFLIEDYLFFILTAKWYGKKCDYDCALCKNWACTHGTKYEGSGCFPVIDYSKWCLKK